MELEQALAVVKSAGYRVSKPRASKPGSLAFLKKLNAVGKPYGENYDPNYRMKYRTPPLKRAQNVNSFITPEQWTQMCKLAQAQWNQTMKESPNA